MIFEGSVKVKEYLKDPSAFQTSAPVESTPSNNTNTETAKPIVEDKKPEKDEESAELGGLFGDDD